MQQVEVVRNPDLEASRVSAEGSSEESPIDQQPMVHHGQKPKPVPDVEEDKESFFFTMVNVEGNVHEKSQPTPSQESQFKEASSDTSQPQVSPLEDVKLLLERFNRYDHKLSGMIPLEHAKSIFVQMGIDTTNFQAVANILIMTKQTQCTFDEFLAILYEFEEKRFQFNDKKLFSKREFKTDPRLIAFIRLLDEYRRKNQQHGEYKQAKSAKVKIQEMKEKEAVRRQASLRIIHNQELNSLEMLQRNQFQEFSDSWDKYMTDYEKAAMESLQNLKGKHIMDLEDYDSKIRTEVPKIYYSKQVLELRTKQKNLVKLQQYEEAGKIRLKIDDLESVQQGQYQVDTGVSLQNKINNLRTKQTATLNALLKKIQKDRNQQLKQRQGDSERLIVKNRNMRNQLMHRHQDQIKRAMESLRELMIIDEPHRDRKRGSGEMSFK